MVVRQGKQQIALLHVGGAAKALRGGGRFAIESNRATVLGQESGDDVENGAFA